MSWDLQDIGAHLCERHGFIWLAALEINRLTTFEDREKEHDLDHADPEGIGHSHNPKDPRIIKEE